jgi:hypothetical protein
LGLKLLNLVSSTKYSFCNHIMVYWFIPDFFPHGYRRKIKNVTA